MECIEARALKSSFLSQMAVKTSSQVFYNDDVWCLTGINTADDFRDVDELLNLDFSEKEFQEVLCFSQEDDDDDVMHKEGSNHSSSTFSGADDFDSLSAAELPVPADELENLEWLSQFVDDSTTSSGLSLLCPAGSFTERASPDFGNRFVTVNRPLRKIHAPFFHAAIPVKPRSKRCRSSNGRTWSLSSPPLSSGDSSSSTTSSSYGSSILSPFLFTNPVRETEWFFQPPAKKQKRRTDGAETVSVSVSGRRCTHCQVQKTPQWRTGPMGPKTLCNACGVRFKSGRLFPEYRPAFSPTFSHEVHSNSHRKVLEMRRKKEMVVGVPEPGSPLMVQSI